MLDQLIIEFDKALRTVFAEAPTTRPLPGGTLPEMDLDNEERRHSAALMRVNHSGEICAQALYQGQSLTSRNRVARESLCIAAHEETEHLNWTASRIAGLGGRKSLLNPIWYAGSLGIGVAAGLCGDDWSLGFLAETERQVESHLEGHLGQLADGDLKSRAILDQMKADEVGHAIKAQRLGGRDLPAPFRCAMKLASGVMTRTAYYI